MEVGNGMSGMGEKLTIRDLEVKRGSRVLVSRLNLHARSGELIVLRGSSGSGKTTILRAIAGLDGFETGTIEVGEARLEGGRRPDLLMWQRLHRSVGLVFQFHCLFEHMTALQNVCLAPVHVHGMSAREAEQTARELLAQLGVESRAGDRKSTRLNSSHSAKSRMPSSA